MATSRTASAADDDDAAAYAVQNREYRLGHELHAGIGTLPLNAFSKGFTVGGGYTYHFNSLWAWEIAQFEYSIGIDTGLKKQLLDNFQVQPTQIESVSYIGSSTILFKPFYGKLAAVNRSVIHMEIFLALGGAFAHYQNPDAYRFGFDAGAGIRFYLGEHFSFRLDVRDYTFFNGTKPESELYLGLAAALSFGGAVR
jgi:outer membrane beta-barrel protein